LSSGPIPLGLRHLARYHWSYGTMQQGVGEGVHPVEVMTRSLDQRWTLRTLSCAINARPSNNVGLP